MPQAHSRNRGTILRLLSKTYQAITYYFSTIYDKNRADFFHKEAAESKLSVR